MFRLYILLFITIYITSCSYVSDAPRTLWGSSVRVLENERERAIVKEFQCAQDSCFDTVFSMTKSYREQKSLEAESKKSEEVEGLMRFMADRNKGYIILMHVPEAVDTTEVGVFFKRSSEGATKVEVSSLSSLAKSNAAKIIFERLAGQYETVNK